MMGSGLQNQLGDLPCGKSVRWYVLFTYHPLFLLLNLRKISETIGKNALNILLKIYFDLLICRHNYSPGP